MISTPVHPVTLTLNVFILAAPIWKARNSSTTSCGGEGLRAFQLRRVLLQPMLPASRHEAMACHREKLERRQEKCWLNPMEVGSVPSKNVGLMYFSNTLLRVFPTMAFNSSHLTFCLAIFWYSIWHSI